MVILGMIVVSIDRWQDKTILSMSEKGEEHSWDCIRNTERLVYPTTVHSSVDAVNPSQENNEKRNTIWTGEDVMNNDQTFVQDQLNQKTEKERREERQRQQNSTYRDEMILWPIKD